MGEVEQRKSQETGSAAITLSLAARIAILFQRVFAITSSVPLNFDPEALSH
jgi:hypothetical protein